MRRLRGSPMRSARAQALSVGLVGNAAEVLPELVRRGVTPDVLTDQTSAHDMLNGYVPEGMSLGRCGSAAHAGSRGVRRALDRKRRRSTSPPCSQMQRARRDHLRLRQQHPHGRARCGARACVRLSGLRSRVRASALLRREGTVPLGRALRRSEGSLIAPTSSFSSSSRTMRSSRAGSRSRARRCTSRDCPRASAGSARAIARSSASR